MKTLKASFGVGLFILAATLSGPIHVCRGQILVGGWTNQSASPLSSVPSAGTFYSAQLLLPPSPFDWLPQLPLYAYGPVTNQVYVVDDRNFDYPSYWASLAAAAANSGGMGAMDANSALTPAGRGTNSSGTNTPGAVGVPGYHTPAYSTDDLWLEILSATNGTARLKIHAPSYEPTNAVYGVFYTTNLSPPISWRWVTNSIPGQALLNASNAVDAQGFYRLGLTNISAGTDFWLAFPAMYPTVNSSFQLSLYVSSQVTNSGMVTIPGLAFSNNFSLSPGAVTNIAIPNSAIIADWGAVCTNGIHVVAAQPVSVCGLYYYRALSAAFTAHPTPMLGTNYCLMARPSLIPSDYSAFSQFAVLATENGTTVWITPSASADLAVTNVGAYNVPLDQACLYQIYGSYFSGDVTGTVITSDKPIAVFAGADDAYVPADTEADNPLVQEQLPVCAWGNQVLALSFGRPGGDSYRVLSVTNTTLLITTTNGVLTNNLTGGQPYDAILDGPVQFQASNPIQVAQFALGGNYGDNGGTGDPCEILLPSTGHYLTSYTVAIPTNDYVIGDFDINFLNVIVPQSAIPATMMDGAAITNFVAMANFEQVGSSDYSAARIPVTPGSSHTISSPQPIEVEVYGFAVYNNINGQGGYDAYGYLGGLLSFP